MRRFCKECANIRVVRSGSSIAAAEFEGKSPHRDIEKKLIFMTFVMLALSRYNT